MRHDVIEDRYARAYEQPFQLSELGNEVLGVCLSYRPCITRDELHTGNRSQMRWVGYSSGIARVGIFFYPFKLLKIAKKFSPDLIVSSSDCIHIVLGKWLANKISCKFSADLYDDYESFGLAKIPFLKYFYRMALKQACAISCVSSSLTNYVRSWNKKTNWIAALPSTIDKSIFYTRNRDQMRENFNLPKDKTIIGTAGGLTKEKGIEAVYKATLTCLDENPNIHFVIAGSIDRNCPPPTHERIHYLGKLPHHKVAELFCALDVGIVYLRNTTYGRLSFPQKAYEMASCKIPMVVADVGDMSILFSKEKNELYTADDPVDLAFTIQRQIEHPCIPNLDIEDWREHGKKLNQLYLDALEVN